MSLVQIVNSTGPSVEPCGTPDSMGLAEETEPFTTVWNLLFWKCVLTVFRILARKPQQQSFVADFVECFLQI
ncbi:hypothetical protein Trydic_g6587 [Trypoxylus dichotomus]